MAGIEEKMTLTKKQITSILLLLALVFSLPVAIYLTRKMQDVRPRALQGKANFLLSTDSISSTVGKNIDVLVSLQITDAALRVSGVDFLLLYDKNRLDVGNIVPNVITVDPKAPFTDAPMVTSGGSFDENYNFIRVTEIARRPDTDLPKGTFQLAKVTFRGRAVGTATIKFPEEDKYLEIVGTGTSGIFQNVVSTPTPTVTPGGPTLTPTPTLRPGQPSNTPVPGQSGGGGGGGGGSSGTGGSGGSGGCDSGSCGSGYCCIHGGGGNVCRPNDSAECGYLGSSSGYGLCGRDEDCPAGQTCWGTPSTCHSGSQPSGSPGSGGNSRVGESGGAAVKLYDLTPFPTPDPYNPYLYDPNRPDNPPPPAYKPWDEQEEKYSDPPPPPPPASSIVDEPLPDNPPQDDGREERGLPPPPPPPASPIVDVGGIIETVGTAISDTWTDVANNVTDIWDNIWGGGNDNNSNDSSGGDGSSGFGGGEEGTVETEIDYGEFRRPEGFY